MYESVYVLDTRSQGNILHIQFHPKLCRLCSNSYNVMYLRDIEVISIFSSIHIPVFMPLLVVVSVCVVVVVGGC